MEHLQKAMMKPGWGHPYIAFGSVRFSSLMIQRLITTSDERQL
ncbi:hypothetical protein K788_00009405 (plasmid) [Paraburkholderia caribensis MBA4]|uniref:Uncharacterized protein n=1 Tax=Paraburkholderia caribensis MBA4 TaxID=1323664 RepID=A0A0P0RQN6_9BURK|nr:hypothetical protein K788_00009405 [Paraburkholderia caribensis MBA4]